MPEVILDNTFKRTELHRFQAGLSRIAWIVLYRNCQSVVGIESDVQLSQIHCPDRMLIRGVLWHSRVACPMMSLFSTALVSSRQTYWALPYFRRLSR
eukprot:3915660-Rhodomonas_salina.1